jgi:hypothetical protein
MEDQPVATPPPPTTDQLNTPGFTVVWEQYFFKIFNSIQ